MSDYSSSPSVSCGWPFSDCTIHIQVRGEDAPDLNFIENTCSKFGRIIKSFVWESKRSGMPHVFVMFNSPDAVDRAFDSTLDRSVRLWRSGHYLLNMCDSTSERLKYILEDDGLTEGHWMFNNIPLKWKPKSCYKKSWTGKQKSYHKTPTGSRYKPYSLDNRPSTSTSAQVSQPSTSRVKISTRRETSSPESVAKSSDSRMKRESRSPSREPLATSPAPSMSSAKQPMIANPPFSVPPTSGSATAPMSASTPAAPDQVVLNLELPNRRLGAGTKELVSNHRESTTKIQNLESENEKLRKSEKAAKDEYMKILQAAKGLKLQCVNLHAGKIKAESECEAAARRITDIEAQLAEAQAQLAARPRPSKPVTAEASAQTEPLRSETEEVSSVDSEAARITPTVTTEHIQNTNPGKPSLEHFVGLSDAFKEIDDLVRTAFDCYKPDSSPSVEAQVTACLGDTTFHSL